MSEVLILFTNRDFSYFQLLINSTARNSPPKNTFIQRAYLLQKKWNLLLTNAEQNVTFPSEFRLMRMANSISGTVKLTET